MECVLKRLAFVGHDRWDRDRKDRPTYVRTTLGAWGTIHHPIGNRCTVLRTARGATGCDLATDRQTDRLPGAPPRVTSSTRRRETKGFPTPGPCSDPGRAGTSALFMTNAMFHLRHTAASSIIQYLVCAVPVPAGQPLGGLVGVVACCRRFALGARGFPLRLNR